MIDRTSQVITEVHMSGSPASMKHQMQSLRISDQQNATQPPPMVKLDSTMGGTFNRGFKGGSPLRKQSECISIDSGAAGNRTKNNDKKRMAMTNAWQRTNKYVQPMTKLQAG